MDDTINLLIEISGEHSQTAKEEKRDIKGEKECPKCGGTVDFIVSGYNGHVRMACRSECFSGIQ
jgi:hypothetical protein